MKKIIISFILVILPSFGFGPSIEQCMAENMSIKVVSMVDNIKTVKVTLTEGISIGVIDRRGLAVFDDGDIALMSCRGTFDSKKGFQGYSSLSFEDGSTLVLAWKGPTSRVPPGGKFGGYAGMFEYAEGTGRFEGIKGSGTFTGKIPNWDEDYSAKGFTYYEFTGTYTLASQKTN